MSGIPGKHLKVARVLHEDNDFITLEVGKRDDVSFHLQQNDEGEVVGGDQFHTIIFVHNATEGDGPPTMATWEPWEDGS